MNPCPCGQWGNPKANCFCSPDKISRYLGKISAPLLDRIDMQITVQPLSEHELIAPHNSADRTSASLRKKVEELRLHQWNRQGCINAHLGAKECEAVAALGHKEREFLSLALSRLKLSARAYHRLLKVARTIADIHNSEKVDLAALQQALAFKQTLQLPR